MTMGTGNGMRIRSSFVVLALVLLAAGAGLLIRSVANLRAIDPGVAVDRLVVLDATMPLRLTPAERRQAKWAAGADHVKQAISQQEYDTAVARQRTAQVQHHALGTTQIRC